MPDEPNLVPISGSQPPALYGAQSLGPASPNEQITVTVKVRSRDDAAAVAGLHEMASKSPRDRQAITREGFAAAHGANPEDMKKIEDYARTKNLNVSQSCPARRRVVLHGTVSDFERAFGVTLHRYAHAGGTYRFCMTDIKAPNDIAPRIEAVLGLSNRPAAKPHFQYLRKTTAAAHAFGARVPSPLSPLDVAKLYKFPAGLNGSGQCIAIIELGGGYIPNDLDTYFRGLGISQAPQVIEVSVLGAKNTPGGDADGEVMLDIEVAGAVAPKAKLVVYFAPNTNQGFVQAISDAAHDAVNKPSVISISWGGPESSWRASDRTAMNNALRDASLLGVTVTVASGDNGSTDGAGDGQVHVDFPASSPFALACGGTRLEGTGSTITEEVVWDDGPNSATGGGVSDAFTVPAYQSGSRVPTSISKPGFAGRGVPDVAGNADPNSGYKVRVDGSDTVVGGTSAVAPLWAGLVALINEKLGKPAGFLNPLLYSSVSASGGFRDITSGSNGDFSSQVGWDACTGLGSPNGAAILEALAGGSAPSNTPPSKKPTPAMA